MLKIQLMKPAKHAIARPRRGRVMACFADTNWALRTPADGLTECIRSEGCIRQKGRMHFSREEREEREEI